MNLLNLKVSGAVVGAVAVGLVVGRTWAESLPEPVGGVLTLSVASGTTSYDDAVPATVTKVVKTGAGEAVLSAASTSFAGSAEVEAGTLTLTDTDYKALGSGRPITVLSGATVAFKGRTAKNQGETIYSGTITISGDGVGGLGAIYWAPSDGSDVLSDAAIKSIVLAADATIGGTKRYGSRNGTIDLQGYTLKERDVDYMFNATVLKGPGRFEKTVKGTLYIQSGTYVQNGGYTNTFIRATGGAVSFWSMDRLLDVTVEVNGGAPQLGAGDYLSGRNHIAAMKLLGAARDIGLMTATPMREINIHGDIDMNQYSLTRSGEDVIWHNGSFLNSVADKAILSIYGGLLIYTNAAVTSRLPQTFVRNNNSAARIASRIDCRGGNVKTDFLRVGPDNTRGVVRTTAGFFDGGSAVYCGQNGGIGVIAVEGGHFRVNGMNLSNGKFGHSIVRQTGGLLDNPGGTLFQVGAAGFAGIYMTGGTNTTRRSLSQTDRVQLACLSNAVARLAVSGKDTLFETEKLTIGAVAAAGPEDVVVSLNDGGVLAADRITVNNMPAGSTYYATFDGGVLRPYFAYAWPGMYYEPDAETAAAFVRRCPTRGVVFGKGVVIDMSQTRNDKDVAANVSSHINFRFDAPEGKTITSITLPDSVKDVLYGCPVPIVFESATGYGASAVADVDYETGKLTGVTLFSGGCNYDADTKVYVYDQLRSGTGTAKIECAFTLGDPVCGPLVKRGRSTALLFVENTYTGGTVVEEGAIQFGTAEAFPADTPVTLGKPDQCSTAVIDFYRRNDTVPAFDVTISKLSGYGSVVNAKRLTITEGVEIEARQLFANGRSLYMNEPVVFAAGTKITVKDPENLPDPETIKGKVRFLYAEGQTVTGTPTLDLPADYANKWCLRQKGNMLYLAPNRGLTILLR